MKPIRLTKHAREQCLERGATEDEVVEAIRNGTREPAKLGRELCRFNFSFSKKWQGNYYAIKQIAPVIKEEANICYYRLFVLLLESPSRRIRRKESYENQL